MTDVVLLEVSERIATVTLNRPEARNALSSEVLRLLPRAAAPGRRRRRGRRRSSSPGPTLRSAPGST